jgi:NAD(P)-dependent dehydrogenase (short-subunit alcohol dehydrogenase family)
LNLRGKTLFISGASRSFGLAGAQRAARDGANIAVVAKTATLHRHLSGTIYTAPPILKWSGAARWFAGHVTYTTSKYAMPMVTLDIAIEYREADVAFNTLSTRVGIATAAVEFTVDNAEELHI